MRHSCYYVLACRLLAPCAAMHFGRAARCIEALRGRSRFAGLTAGFSCIVMRAVTLHVSWQPLVSAGVIYTLLREVTRLAVLRDVALMPQSRGGLPAKHPAAMRGTSIGRDRVTSAWLLRLLYGGVQFP